MERNTIGHIGMNASVVDCSGGLLYSDKGFFIGDISYALKKNVYHDLWIDELGFEEGVIRVSRDLCFGVGSTAYGDGTYTDNHGNSYHVDSGVLGIVPLELVDDERPDVGLIVYEDGDAEFYQNDGYFDIRLPNGLHITIDTGERDA